LLKAGVPQLRSHEFIQRNIANVGKEGLMRVHARRVSKPVLIVCALAAAAGLVQWMPPHSGFEQMWVSDVEAAANARNPRRPDHFVGAGPENVVWGGFPIDQPPVLTIDSGDTVRIDVISQSGATNATADPVTYFGQFGVQPAEVLQDVIDFWNSRPARPQYGPHVLTGPVYVNGAEPGDVLEIQVLDLEPRVPYGLNSTAPMGGVLGTGYPGYRTGDPGLDIPAAPPDAIAGLFPDVRQHLYRVTKKKGQLVALFSREIEVPLKPFMGVMGVAPATDVFVGSTPTAPPPALGVQGSGPPGPFGGNMDLHDLTIGSTLYLPVFQTGGQFFTGDSHSAQGDGEVSGTAIEHSLSGVFRFVVHKGKSLEWPRAEDKDYYIMMGIDHDLDRAMRLATLEVVEFLVEEKGLTQAKAFSLASIAVDFHAAEVVDGTQLIVGKIPKALFLKH
jgi:acetamidase/formamidase